MGEVTNMKLIKVRAMINECGSNTPDAVEPMSVVRSAPDATNDVFTRNLFCKAIFGTEYTTPIIKYEDTRTTAKGLIKNANPTDPAVSIKIIKNASDFFTDPDTKGLDGAFILSISTSTKSFIKYTDNVDNKLTKDDNKSNEGCGCKFVTTTSPEIVVLVNNNP